MVLLPIIHLQFSIRKRIHLAWCFCISNTMPLLASEQKQTVIKVLINYPIHTIDIDLFLPNLRLFGQFNDSINFELIQGLKNYFMWTKVIGAISQVFGTA